MTILSGPKKVQEDKETPPVPPVEKTDAEPEEKSTQNDEQSSSPPAPVISTDVTTTPATNEGHVENATEQSDEVAARERRRI